MSGEHEENDEPITDFGSIYNWCDRHCERCPQRIHCTLSRTISERELEELAKKDEPEPEPEMVDTAVIRARLDEMMQMLREEIGEDPDAPLSLDGPRMQRLGREIGTALCTHPRARIQELALTVMMKASRLSYVFEREEIDDGIWLLDTAPNILLLERTARSLDEELAALPEDDPHRTPIAAGVAREADPTQWRRPGSPGTPAEIRTQLARLMAIFTPLEERLAPSRILLEGWIARGAAPSPWLRETLVAAND